MSGSWLEMLDRDATLAVNNFSGAFTDAVMPVLSNRVVMIPIYLPPDLASLAQAGVEKDPFRADSSSARRGCHRPVCESD